MILAVSFGTVCDAQRALTIGAIEQAIAEAFPDQEVRRAFASQTVIDALREPVDGVVQALDRAAADGVRDLIVQPLYVADGYGYKALEETLAAYQHKFGQAVLGTPLLCTDADLDIVAEAVAGRTAAYADGRTAVCLMGHGTRRQEGQDGVYHRLQERLRLAGCADHYVGTMHGMFGSADVAAAIKGHASYDRAVLMPLMLTAGRHVLHHMAGDAKDSWKSVLAGEGYEIVCVMEGLGQLPAVRALFVEHVRSAAARLRQDGAQSYGTR